MVENLVKRSISALTSRQTNIFTAASFIILTTVLSQILGFLKYRLLASIFGASSDLGLYFAAFRIPDFIFTVVIAGALSASFIPIFTDYLSKNKKHEAFEFASALVNIGLIFFIFISAIIIVFAYQLCALVAPGFSHNELVLMSRLMIIIQLSQIFFILGTIFTATLQSFQHFVIPGIATAFYNFGIILGLIIFSSFLGFGIYGATLGVLIGSLLFCLVQLPTLFATGFGYQAIFKMDHAIRKLIKLMIPRSATLIVSQIGATANIYFASFISARSLVVFEFAQTLGMAPVLLLGQSIAQATFPALSLKSESKQEFLAIFTASFNQIVYLTLPISAILIVLRIPLVRLVFGASKFDWPATVDTGLTLAYFSVALTANAAMPLLSRAFYAFKDSKTPLVITSFCVILNILMSYLFIRVYAMPIYYLALSFSASSILGIFIMLFFLNKKIELPKSFLLMSFLKILISSIVMGAALYIPIKLLDQLVFDTTRTINLVLLTGIASFAGFCAYVFFTWLFDLKEASYIVEVLKKFKNRDMILKQVGELLEGPRLNN